VDARWEASWETCENLGCLWRNLGFAEGAYEVTERGTYGGTEGTRGGPIGCPRADLLGDDQANLMHSPHEPKGPRAEPKGPID